MKDLYLGMGLGAVVSGLLLLFLASGCASTPSCQRKIMIDQKTREYRGELMSGDTCGAPAAIVEVK